MWTIYKIYYKDEIVYVGRTNNIENRIRQHMLSGKLIDIFKVSKIDYAEVETEADMNLYELYYILLYKPRLNKKDVANDSLTIILPVLQFKEFFTYLWSTWEDKVRLNQLKKKEKQQYINVAREMSKSETSTVGKEILQQQIYLADK